VVLTATAEESRRVDDAARFGVGQRLVEVEAAYGEIEIIG